MQDSNSLKRLPFLTVTNTNLTPNLISHVSSSVPVSLPLCRSLKRTIMLHGCTGMASPSPQGPSPPSGRCQWPSSPLVACCRPSAWASSPSGLVLTPCIPPLCRPEEVDGKARSGQLAGGDEGGEEKDGHGEEGVHPGALSLFALPPAHHHFHPAAALPAAVWDQRSELLLRTATSLIPCFLLNSSS